MTVVFLFLCVCVFGGGLHRNLVQSVPCQAPDYLCYFCIFRLKDELSSVITDLIKQQQKPKTEEKTTATEINYDMVKMLQRSLSEAKQNLLHCNLKVISRSSSCMFLLYVCYFIDFEHTNYMLLGHSSMVANHCKHWPQLTFMFQ